MKKILALLIALLLTFSLAGCSETEILETVEVAGVIANTLFEDTAEDVPAESGSTTNTASEIDEDGWYYSAEDVSLYLYTFGYLPENFITKEEARDLGWEGGSVEEYAPGYAIGGDQFGNREGLLPENETYYECDIDTNGQNSRGAKRIVFSDDLIYYTEDHYESFVLLYGEE